MIMNCNLNFQSFNRILLLLLCVDCESVILKTEQKMVFDSL